MLIVLMCHHIPKEFHIRKKDTIATNVIILARDCGSIRTAFTRRREGHRFEYRLINVL